MKKIILLLFIVAIVVLYSLNAQKKDFFDIYTKNDKPATDLKQFMQMPTTIIQIDGTKWKYLRAGKGQKVILFAHGMGGAYNLWWQQVKAFEGDFTVITYSLPAEIDNLEDAAKGIIKILDTEKIDNFYLVGTSMGGYIAQYLLDKIPNRIEKVVLSNTFSQNTLLPKIGKQRNALTRWIPEIIISHLGKKVFEDSLLPAAQNSNLLRAILSYLPFSKKQIINRMRVVIDPFFDNPAAYAVKSTSKLIIESDNDPLIVESLRQQLKAKYPQAEVYTFHNQGHFPYINASDEYNTVLLKFFNSGNPYLTVEDTINNRYVLARKNADLELLSTAFDKTALLYTSTKDHTIQITLEDYFNKVSQDGPLTLNTKILSGNIENEIANFRVAFNYPDKTYIDNLVLLKINNTWKIINKTFKKVQ